MKHLALLLLLGFCAGPGFAQDADDGPTGFTVAGIPALNYNSDEGIGYGARASLYNHAEGGYNPYFYTIEANIFLTTGGRRQFFLFFDSLHLLGPKERLTSEIKYEKFDPSPYYGIGNDTGYDEDLIDEESPAFLNDDYYGFERERFTLWITYQRRFGSFRVLGGLGLVHSDIAFYDAPTLLQRDHQAFGKQGGFTNYVKVGLIYDTRDFEPAPGRGDWSDVILEVSDGAWGSDYDYARLTLTNRHYVTLARNVVFAQRIVFEKSWGDLPFYEMTFFGGSFKIDEGLGGAKSIRGQLRNRFQGPMKLFGNLELRWRLWDFQILDQNLYLALSGFLDYGRVWHEGEAFAVRDFHTGQGGGVHLGWNETFLVTADVARSNEVDLAFYLGIGYLY